MYLEGISHFGQDSTDQETCTCPSLLADRVCSAPVTEKTLRLKGLRLSLMPAMLSRLSKKTKRHENRSRGRVEKKEVNRGGRGMRA